MQFPSSRFTAPNMYITTTHDIMTIDRVAKGELQNGKCHLSLTSFLQNVICLSFVLQAWPSQTKPSLKNEHGHLSLLVSCEMSCIILCLQTTNNDNCLQRLMNTVLGHLPLCCDRSVVILMFSKGANYKAW